VQIDHAIDAIMALLQRHKFCDRTKIIAQMQITRWLNARKHQFLESSHRLKAPFPLRGL
jgi:hypothetical protein